MCHLWLLIRAAGDRHAARQLRALVTREVSVDVPIEGILQSTAGELQQRGTGHSFIDTKGAVIDTERDRSLT